MPDKDLNSIVNEAFRQLKENLRRLRSLEERYDLIDNRIGNIQSSILEKTSESKNQITKISTDLKEMQEKMLKIENTLARIDRKLDKTVSTSELQEIKQLVSLYNPFSKKK